MRNTHILAALLALLTASSACSPRRCVRPEFLKPGDKVALVAPSYWTPDSNIAKACVALREFGLEPVVSPQVFSRWPEAEADTFSFFAGTDSERADALRSALEDPEIKAIICTRGGYGAIHTLQNLPDDIWRKHPKWLVGYSDVTALHLASVKSGVMSIHGNMAVNLANNGIEEEGNSRMLNLLMGEIPPFDIPPTADDIFGTAEGVLLGGNLITMMTLLGSGYDCIGDRDCILYVEEVEESMHAIDRLLAMPGLTGRLNRIKGVVFGEFTDCGDEFAYGSVEEMIVERMSGLGIPASFGFASGHGELNLPFIEGLPVRMEVGPEGTTISPRSRL